MAGTELLEALVLSHGVVIVTIVPSDAVLIPVQTPEVGLGIIELGVGKDSGVELEFGTGPDEGALLKV